MPPSPRPIALIVLDGWGYRTTNHSNAILAARTPNWDKFWQHYPHVLLHASGLEVGLPRGQMGNSEVGHLTMGAGRVVYQDLTRISMDIESGEFNKNPVLISALTNVREKAKTLHVLGLLSPGGVHSHEDHIFTLIKLAKNMGVQKIVVHAFLDGRDTPPKSAMASLRTLDSLCHSITGCQIGSISGRYFAMDRDKRFERTERVYQLLTEGSSDYHASTACEALQKAYDRGETDEFVSPTLITPVTSTTAQTTLQPSPSSLIEEGDSVIFMNFRADRARQLSYALTDPHFTGFVRHRCPALSEFITLTEYAPNLKASILYSTQPLNNLLGEFLEKHHLSQFRIAETEKYAHVTHFFNGGRDAPFKAEERVLIPSVKVATYDLAPAMSALEITEQLQNAILHQSFDVIICNFANADMVGHTGNFKATVQAIEILDDCLGKVVQAIEHVHGEALITADHGNAEIMFDEATGQPHTAHTSELVPLIYIGHRAQFDLANQNNSKCVGGLADIAPTLITLLGLPIPNEMTGRNLLCLQ